MILLQVNDRVIITSPAFANKKGVVTTVHDHYPSTSKDPIEVLEVLEVLLDNGRTLAFNRNSLLFDFRPEKTEEPKQITPYHTRHIPKGVYGELSKIYEEIEELKDAEKQCNPILMLCELADIIGAIDGYLEKHHGMTVEDALKMTKLNKEAFKSGYRK